jgi:hypothetical protein
MATRSELAAATGSEPVAILRDAPGALLRIRSEIVS